MSYNEIYFKATSDFNHFQIDMASNMDVMLIEFEGERLEFNREFDAVFVYFSRTIERVSKQKLKFGMVATQKKLLIILGMEVFLGRKMRMKKIGLAFLVKD